MSSTLWVWVCSLFRGIDSVHLRHRRWMTLAAENTLHMNHCDLPPVMSSCIIFISETICIQLHNRKHSFLALTHWISLEENCASWVIIQVYVKKKRIYKRNKEMLWFRLLSKLLNYRCLFHKGLSHQVTDSQVTSVIRTLWYCVLFTVKTYQL